jgi:hypothetical protein
MSRVECSLENVSFPVNYSGGSAIIRMSFPAVKQSGEEFPESPRICVRCRNLMTISQFRSGPATLSTGATHTIGIAGSADSEKSFLLAGRERERPEEFAELRSLTLPARLVYDGRRQSHFSGGESIMVDAHLTDDPTAAHRHVKRDTLPEFAGNEDDLNQHAGKSVPELLRASIVGTNNASADDHRTGRSFDRHQPLRAAAGGGVHIGP